MKPNMPVFGVLALLVSVVPAPAHHAFSAEYDANKPVTLRGTLTKMDWVNPHGWIYIDVKGSDGKVVNWAIETGSTNQMIRRGLRRTDFPIGTEVVVEGYMSRDRAATVLHERLIRLWRSSRQISTSGDGEAACERHRMTRANRQRW